MPSSPFPDPSSPISPTLQPALAGTTLPLSLPFQEETFLEPTHQEAELPREILSQQEHS